MDLDGDARRLDDEAWFQDDDAEFWIVSIGFCATVLRFCIHAIRFCMPVVWSGCPGSVARCLTQFLDVHGTLLIIWTCLRVVFLFVSSGETQVDRIRRCPQPWAQTWAHSSGCRSWVSSRFVESKVGISPDGNLCRALAVWVQSGSDICTCLTVAPWRWASSRDSPGDKVSILGY